MYLKGTELEVDTSSIYLGVELFKNGNWVPPKNKSLNVAHGLSINFITSSTRSLSLFCEQLKLFDFLVGSILSYSVESWGNHDAHDIEKVHINFFRNILGLRKSTNISALYG